MADSDATMLTKKAVTRISRVVREVEDSTEKRGTAGWNARRGGDGGGGSIPRGEFQGDGFQMLTNNAEGFGPTQFIPPRT